jgi:hypothetical protein
VQTLPNIVFPWNLAGQQNGENNLTARKGKENNESIAASFYCNIQRSNFSGRQEIM